MANAEMPGSATSASATTARIWPRSPRALRIRSPSNAPVDEPRRRRGSGRRFGQDSAVVITPTGVQLRVRRTRGLLDGGPECVVPERLTACAPRDGQPDQGVLGLWQVGLVGRIPEYPGDLGGRH